jgi:poly-gamma-glutamate synthesis protein (capsule biosynthesis protein)
VTEGSATVGLMGDVMLGRAVAGQLQRQAPQSVWSDDVIEVCESCDAVLANLECCISERGTPTSRIPGKPFFFRAPPTAVDALRAAGVVAVSGANNHALDYETEALLDTLDYLEAAGLALAGAGGDAERARRGLMVDIGGVRLGLVALTDHPVEFAAGDEEPGVAWADLPREVPQWATRELRRLRAEADLLVAFPHWGPNMTTAPARWQRQRAAELIAAGADLVAGHSSHVFHGVERIEEKLVLSDLGDALDDYAVDARLRNDLGFLALWHPGGDPDLELVGLRLDFCRTDLARGADAEWIAQRLERACAELGTPIERSAEQRFALVR